MPLQTDILVHTKFLKTLLALFLYYILLLTKLKCQEKIMFFLESLCQLEIYFFFNPSLARGAFQIKLHSVWKKYVVLSSCMYCARHVCFCQTYCEFHLWITMRNLSHFCSFLAKRTLFNWYIGLIGKKCPMKRGIEFLNLLF